MSVTGLRFRADTGWELRCDNCSRKQQQCYWPLDSDFWMPGRMTKCRACHNDEKAARMKALRAKDPESDRARVRRYQAANKDVLAMKASARRSEWDEERRAADREKSRQWRQENPERWRAIQMRYRANNIEKVRAWEREYARRRRRAQAEARAA